MLCADANAPRFSESSTAGHYESWFLRANDPSGKRAIWIRYTIYAGKGAPISAAEGELWAAYFDRTNAATPIAVAVKEVTPLARCTFAGRPLALRIGDAFLNNDGAEGTIRNEAGHPHTRWSLTFAGNRPPILLLAPPLYDAPFPKAKALVPRPGLRLSGTFAFGDHRVDLDGWRGSQNHNWGARHTDRYAWGQCVGFEGHPESFLEVSTAQVDIGPLRSPWLTPMTLVHDGETFTFGTIMGAVANHGDYGSEREGCPGAAQRPTWQFRARSGAVRIEGEMHAPASHFVALPYRNPPGGTKYCLNSKVAHCTLRLRRRGRVTVLRTEGAAFEILAGRCPSTIALAFA